jgi:hypothetical protein
VKRRAATVAAAGLALALAACPLPQPVPDVGRVDGGTVPTPHILPESAVPSETVVFVNSACRTPPVFSVSATVEDANTIETVTARWFVDYGIDGTALTMSPQGGEAQVLPSQDANDPLRPLDPFLFRPYQFGKDVPLHVLEVVVSNGFLPLNDSTPPLNRAAPLPFEAQAFRWVFQYVDPADTRGRCQ